MSKVEHDRPRHIAVRVYAVAAVSRAAVADALRLAAKAAGWPEAERPRLTRYAFPHAFVRVPHERQRDVTPLVRGITAVTDKGKPVEVSMRTFGASGTMRALAERTGVLAARDT